jgi:hypothetical protein
MTLAGALLRSSGTKPTYGSALVEAHSRRDRDRRDDRRSHRSALQYAGEQACCYKNVANRRIDVLK